MQAAAAAVWALLLFTTYAGAQNLAPSAEQKVIPPAPTTATLGRFGGVPVDLNAGAATVAVPLVELRGRQLSHTVSLSYRTTGIRVDEVASWVGLGWSLNAGGVITRTVRGLPDEEYGTQNIGYYAGWNTWYTADSLCRLAPTAANKAAKYQADAQVANGTLDIEPDYYNVSLPGQGAAFTTTAAGRPILKPYKDWRVTGGPQGGWTITTEDGTVYEFGQAETTTIDNTDGTSSEFQSAWHLTRIVSADGTDAITFEYQTHGRSRSVPVYKVTKAKLLVPGRDNNVRSASYVVEDPPFSDGVSTVAPLYETYYLTAIQAATGRVTLTSANDRRDIVPNQDDLPGRRLTAVDVVPADGGAVRQHFDFAYGYFNDAPLMASKTQRLRLDAVQERGKPPYSFTYSDVGLPPRGSAGQDHWGYANGGNNATLLPALPAGQAAFYKEADRASAFRGANGAYGRGCVLQAVQYPTGGHTVFTYEPNVVTGPVSALYGEDMGTMDGRQVAVNGDPTRDAVSEQVYQMLYSNFQEPGVNGIFVKAEVIELPNGADNVTLTSHVDRYTSTTPQPPGFFLYRVPAGGLSALTSSSPQLYPMTGTVLAAGTYVLAVSNFEANDNATLTLRMRVLPAPGPGTGLVDRVVGGLRLKRMADYAGLGDSVVTSYDYTRYDAEAQRRVSTGKLFVEPVYVRVAPSGSLIVMASNISPAQATDPGYHVGYAQVTATRLGGGGSTRYTYGNYDEAGLRNLLLEEASFDAAGREVKRVVQGYHMRQLGRVRRSAVTYERNLFGYCTQPQCDEFYVLGGPIYATDYTTDYIWASVPASTLSRQYASAGGAYRDAFTAYRYHQTLGAGWHPQPTQVHQALGPGDTLKTITRYATDYAAAATAADTAVRALADLQARHRLTAVVEQLQWRERGAARQLVGGRLTEYAGVRPRRLYEWQAVAPVAPNQFAPSAVQAGRLVKDGRYREAVAWERYGVGGTLLQQRRAGGPPTSYVWGHDYTAPIAEARNALASQLAFTSFEAASPGGWDYPTAARTLGGQTGQWALNLSHGAGAEAVRDSLPAGDYVLQWWATGQSQVRVNTAPAAVPAPAAERGAWRQYRLRLAVPANGAVAVHGTGLLDAVQLCPAGAQMTTLTHRPAVGTDSQTDAAGRTVFYDYDAAGRLQRVRDEHGRILTEQEYHYARPN